MRRLYSTFSHGWPGAGLLVMRVLSGAALIMHDPSGFADSPIHPAIHTALAIVAGLFLLAGLWTSLSGSMVAVLGMWSALGHHGDPWLHILLATIGVAVVLLGPGAWSIDAQRRRTRDCTPCLPRGIDVCSLGHREERPCMSKPADLVQGTLEVLILKIVALEALNGWAIGQRLTQVSGDVLQVSDGSLYPALHKLEQDGLLASEWRPSENNRRAKFYSLTRVGRKRLQKEAANWERVAGAISHVLALKEI